MKHKLLLLLMALAALLPSRVVAQDFTYTYEGQTLNYSVISDSDRTVRVSGSGIVGDLTIPETVIYEDTEYAVTNIGHNAFVNCYSLTSLKIPDTVTSIDSGAFINCTSMTSIKLPNTITSISDEILGGCTSLISVEIPSSVTSIGLVAFRGCTSLTSVKIPDSVTSIEREAFAGCKSLTSIVLPNSIHTIIERTFSECSKLANVEIPNTVTAIGHSAFSDCSSLVNITIPSSVTSIGEAAFIGCTSLSSIEIPNTITVIRPYTFHGCSSMTSIEIPASVALIGEYAFARCTSLEIVRIPELVTKIDQYAFEDCNALKHVYYETSDPISGDKSIFSDYAYENAYLHMPEKGLEKAESLSPWMYFTKRNDNVSAVQGFSYTYEGQTLNYTVLSNSQNLVTVSGPSSKDIEGTLLIPDKVSYEDVDYTVTSIDNNAFQYCDKLTSVNLGQNIKKIGELAFAECYSLYSIVIPKSVNEIENFAFRDCNNLKSVVILSSDIEFGEYAFSGTGIWCIIAPENLDLSKLNQSFNIKTFDPETSVVLENGTVLTDNGKTLFYVHVNPGTSYSIPEGVTKLLAGAIDTAPSANMVLESLTIPSTLEEIEADAFRYAEIGRVNFTDWPSWCANAKLGNLYANPYWNSKPYAGGVLMTDYELKEGMTQILDYVNYGLQFKNEVDLPTTIKRIGAYAFYNNKELYSVILPAGLEEIGESAFEGCELLENPSFPAGLKKIEDGAYKDCIKITEITLPSGLNYLGEMTTVEMITDDYMFGYDSMKGVFQGCTSLEKAVIVCDIDYIDDNLFRSCRNLKTLFLPLQLKAIGTYSFLGTGIDEITFPSTLETIGAYAFSAYDYMGNSGGGTPSITNLVIPNSVTSLGQYAFASQPISRLTIGSGLRAISMGAFMYTEIKELTLSEGLEEIGRSAFEGNMSSGISTVNLPSTLTTLEENAFYHTTICEMNIPDKVMNLPAGSCGNPSVLTIGSGVKEIAANAFSFYRLYTIRLKAHTPPTLTDAFPLTEAENDQLTLIVNTGRQPYYVTNARWKQIDNIIEEGQSEAVIHMTGKNAISTEIRLTTGLMPSSVTKMTVDGPLTANDLVIIKENMPALTSLDMSGVKNVTSLPEKQFNGSLLTDVVLPTDLETIGNSAFANCGLLQIDALPEALKTIGDNAFSGSLRVNIPELPANLQSIGSNAFSGTGICSIVANEALEQLGYGAFSNCNLLETVDLSASSLATVPEYAFSGCYELDEVILPETVKNIGSNAFSGTALRNIDFTTSVSRIGSSAFSNNRRLVAAALPKSLESVGDNLFSNCPRLIAVSMSSATSSVGTQILNGDRKLSNISCAAVEAPTAASGAFDGLRMRYVSLIVPTLSYQSYLDAPGWGKFQTIKNTIPVEIDEGVAASVVAEEEYQNMLEEDALEAAEDAAAEEKVNKERVNSPRLMSARRAVARAKTPQYFASLFDGAQIQTGDDNGEMRVFINPEEGVEITSILFNDEELLPYYIQNNSILLPKGAKGTFKILTSTQEEPAIVLDQTEVEIEETETVQLTATVVGVDDKTVTWSSSDETVATVDQDGLVTALKAGKTTITASTSNGLVAKCELTVEVNTGIEGVEGDVEIDVVVRDGMILVMAPDDAVVEVYSMTGQKMVMTREHCIEGLTSGVYIVRVEGKVFKVMVK